MKKYMDYIMEATGVVANIMPCDLKEELGEVAMSFVMDIREPYKFDCMHIDGSHNLPRRIL